MGRGKCDIAGCACSNYENPEEKCAYINCRHERINHGIIGCYNDTYTCYCKNFVEGDEDVLCKNCGHKRSEHKLTY